MTEIIAIAKCSTSRFTAEFAFLPSLRVTITKTFFGRIIFFKRSNVFFHLMHLICKLKTYF